MCKKKYQKNPPKIQIFLEKFKIYAHVLEIKY